MNMAEPTMNDAGTICYLTKRFPRLSETFILDEILGLEANGVPLRLFAIANPGERNVQPGVANVQSPVVYLRSGSEFAHRLVDGVRMMQGHVRLIRRQPRRWFSTLFSMLSSRKVRHLAKHFFEAGAMADEMSRVRGSHLHAAFAHGPASIAYYVHRLTGRSFSFAAHAKDIYLSSPEVLAAKIAASSFVLACSESAAEEMRRIVMNHPDPNINVHAGKVISAPHGVDVEKFVPNSMPRLIDGPVRILAVGRLVPKKGYEIFLEALGQLRDNGVEFRCRIVGDGNLRQSLETRVATLGLTDVITFCGALTQHEVIDEYHSSDVFVQASVVTPDGDRDGIPNSVLEAMSNGLAVVASTTAGIPEVITAASTGLLTIPGDPYDLARALGLLASDAALRESLGRRARQHVVEHLSRSTCIRPVAELFLGFVTTVSESAPSQKVI